MSDQWMLYGAYGYTGRMMVDEAVSKGLRPVLAGRDEQRTSELASRYDLSYRVFPLSDPGQIRRHLEDMRLVLHCAGPFSATAEPMMRACIDSHTHYLDITGEIDVFALGQSLHDQARHADVVLIPGVGFDVVPTDCLAARLAEQLPAATSLNLAFEAAGGPSPGTAKTSVEGLANGGRIRKDGELISVPLAWKSRRIPFPAGERQAVTIPWGDVFTGYISTGIPNIAVYLAMPPATIKRLQRMRWLQPLLGWGPVQKMMKNRVDKSIKGPSGETREATGCQLWGEVLAADGRRASATMTTPNGYQLTVSAALGITEHLLAESVEGGYYTPSLLMGSGYAESLPGVEIKLSEPA